MSPDAGGRCRSALGAERQPRFGVVRRWCDGWVGGARLWCVGTVAIAELGGRVLDAARLEQVCERYGVARLAVFGSIVRGEARADSDVDLLYVLAPGARLGVDLFDLEDELCEVFGRRVDLVSERSLHRLIRDQAMREARTLYAA